MVDDSLPEDEEVAGVTGEYDDPVYRERFGPGFAYVDGKQLTFALYYDGPALSRSLGIAIPAPPETGDWEDFLRWNARAGLAVADATEAFARSLSPYVRVRVPVEWGGPTSAGPGAIEGQVIQFLLGDQPIERLAALIDIVGAGWWLVKKGLEAATDSPVGIPDGFAVVLAARAIDEQFGTRATEIVDVIGLYPHNLDRMGTPEGYSVALRDDDWLYSIIVSLYGEILGVNRVELSRLSRRVEGTFKDGDAAQG